MSISRVPSALTFIGHRDQPSTKTFFGEVPEQSEVTYLGGEVDMEIGPTYFGEPEQIVDHYGCILCSGIVHADVSNIMWDGGDGMAWDDGDDIIWDE